MSNLNIGAGIGVESSAVITTLSGTILRSIPPSRAEILPAMWTLLESGIRGGHTWDFIRNVGFGGRIAVYGPEDTMIPDTNFIPTEISRSFNRELNIGTRTIRIRIQPGPNVNGREIRTISLLRESDSARMTRGFLYDGDDNGLFGEVLGNGVVWEFYITIIVRFDLPDGVSLCNIPLVGNPGIDNASDGINASDNVLLRFFLGRGGLHRTSFSSSGIRASQIRFGRGGGRRGNYGIPSANIINFETAEYHIVAGIAGSRRFHMFSRDEVMSSTIHQTHGHVGEIAVQGWVNISYPRPVGELTNTLEMHPRTLVPVNNVLFPDSVRKTHFALREQFANESIWWIRNITPTSLSVTGVPTFRSYKFPMLIPTTHPRIDTISPSGRVIVGQTGIWTVPLETPLSQIRFEDYRQQSSVHNGGRLVTDRILIDNTRVREFSEDYQTINLLATLPNLNIHTISRGPLSEYPSGVMFGLNDANQLAARAPENNYMSQQIRIARNANNTENLTFANNIVRISPNQEWVATVNASSIRFFQRDREGSISSGPWQDNDRYILRHTFSVSSENLRSSFEFSSDGKWVLLFSRGGGTRSPVQLFRLNGNTWANVTEQSLVTLGPLHNPDSTQNWPRTLVSSGEENMFIYQPHGGGTTIVYRLIDDIWIGIGASGGTTTTFSAYSGFASNNLEIVGREGNNGLMTGQSMWGTLVVLPEERENISVGFSTAGIHKTDNHTLDYTFSVSFGLTDNLHTLAAGEFTAIQLNNFMSLNDVVINTHLEENGVWAGLIVPPTRIIEKIAETGTDADFRLVSR